MTGSPISDGYGGYITDGYGNDVLDGYPVVSGALPARVGRLQRIIATHFQPEPFAPRPQAAKTPPLFRIINVIPNHRAARHRITIAEHFGYSPYRGRKAFTPYYPGGTGLPAHASQIVVEALGKGDAGARASQIVLEALSSAQNQVRASQFQLESLYQQYNPTYVRASQFVLEVLVPYWEQPPILIYPQLVGLTFDYVKRPKFSTGTGVGSSGREIRVAYWATPQWEWDLTYDILADNGKFTGTTASDLKTLLGFMLDVAGSFGTFYFIDPDDNTVTAQPLGIGDGTSTNFLFSRTYGLTYTGTEAVGGVNLGTSFYNYTGPNQTLVTPVTNIYLNGVLQSPTTYTINTATPCGNYVQFDTPPAAGVVVTADFSFWYLCRFKDDSADFDKAMQNLWDTKKLTIFSLRG